MGCLSFPSPRYAANPAIIKIGPRMIIPIPRSRNKTAQLPPSVCAAETASAIPIRINAMPPITTPVLKVLPEEI